MRHHVGTAAVLHGLALPDSMGRQMWAMQLTTPAIALGSAQSLDAVDTGVAERAAVDVVRRRSGGGAVLLRPGEVLWMDLLLPLGDPRWVDDVGRSFYWLGEIWRRALAAIGIDAEVHREAMVRTPWSDRICFAGLGPGELTVGGRKVVGMSQRRTRAGARFQCLAMAAWDPAALVGLLALTPGERDRARAEVADRATGVGRGSLEPLRTTFVAALEDAT